MGSLFGIISLVLFGALAGWITAKLMRVQTGFWYNVLLGIGGAIIGGFILRLATGSQANGLLANLLVAVLGGCLLTAIVRYVTKRSVKQ